MWGMSLLVEKLLVSDEGLFSVKLVAVLRGLDEDWVLKVLGVH